MSVPSSRQNFIDWMKTIGMLLIVAGHVIGDPYSAFNQIAQPAYTKQLGVAFFVFITGWGLANVRSPTPLTVYSRLFAIFAYGFVFAVLFSLLALVLKGGLQLSNYSPFLLGANVLFNNFPANPTTWYIGTYLHLLVLWFLVTRHISVNMMTLVVAFILENIIRMSLLNAGVPFIAYMLFPNWLTVFLLGHYLHQHTDKPSLKLAAIVGATWVLVAAGWSNVMNGITVGDGFPFRSLFVEEQWAIPLQSLLISATYFISTWLFFQMARCLPESRVVKFFARNTIIIFIIHLPIIFAIYPTYYAWLDTFGIPPLAQQLSLIVFIYWGCAMVSEWITRALRLERWREPLWKRLQLKWFRARPAG
ncbi:acyltransferase [Alteromonas sp. ASW11-19]|uniref:Acyltransferase n=1 Tax=Alteromonas salexigens TaxID=2982530 RepID=A0ABT2VQI1_9ALTE|nr:acyltransferase [Alteromonas salexigens]MCU7555375.1 acyltransferase [Alteromonas salexigens]